MVVLLGLAGGGFEGAISSKAEGLALVENSALEIGDFKRLDKALPWNENPSTRRKIIAVNLQ